MMVVGCVVVCSPSAVALIKEDIRGLVCLCWIFYSPYCLLAECSPKNHRWWPPEQVFKPDAHIIRETYLVYLHLILRISFY